MCTYGIDHTSNKYYSSVMFMRTIFCLRQGQDKPTEEYYRRFESASSTDELAKYKARMHIELNRTHTGGDGKNGTKRLQAMCLLMPEDSGRILGI